MKRTHPKSYTFIGAALAVIFASGCGVAKERDDRIAVASERSQQGGMSSSTDEDLRQIKQFLELYTQNGAMSRDELSNFLEKYKNRIKPFLEGMHLSAQELVDLAFAFDDSRDGKITPHEMAQGLLKRIPILRWIPDNTTEITGDELERGIGEEYPNTSRAARAGLRSALMRFDQFWAQGNGNGKLSRSEISGAGILISVLAQTDFGKGFEIPPGVIPPVIGATPGPGGGPVTININPIVGKVVQQKIDQQLWGRYTITSIKFLSEDDRRLEWMQLGLRFFLIDKLVHHFAPKDGPQNGRLPESIAQSALSFWGFRFQPRWAQLRRIYDHPMMGGDGDTCLSSIEAFNYLSDLDFADKVRVLFKGNFSAKALTASPNKIYVFKSLINLMPRVGEALFTEIDQKNDLVRRSARVEYWDSFQRFDSYTDYGGNNDGVLDDGEITMALLNAKLVENLYELFDTNHDTQLARSEGNKLFAALGITDSRIVDAFYSDTALSTGSPTFWQKLRLFFSGPRGWYYLEPHHFYTRMIQVLPRLIEEGVRR